MRSQPFPLGEVPAEGSEILASDLSSSLFLPLALQKLNRQQLSLSWSAKYIRMAVVAALIARPTKRPGGK